MNLTKNYLFVFIFLSYCLRLNAQNFQWANSFGGQGNDLGFSISHDDSGNVYTTGMFQGTIDFDPGPSVCNLTGIGVGDVFITKHNTSGTFIWAKSINSYSYNGKLFDTEDPSIAIDHSGNIIITGRFVDTIDCDPNSGTYYLNSNGESDIFIVKLNPSGKFIWAKSIGGKKNDEGSSVGIDNSDNVYIAGLFREDTVDFDPGSSTYYLKASDSLLLATFILKLDSLGRFVWAKSLGGDSKGGLENNGKYAVGSLGGPDLVIDNSGNIITTGQFQGTVDFNPNSGTFNITAKGQNNSVDNIFVLQLNSSGGFNWAKSVGGKWWTRTRSIGVDIFNNLCITGTYTDTVDFDPGLGIYYLSTPGKLPSGKFDFASFILKLNSSGNFLWAKDFRGGKSSVVADVICTDKTGNIYTTGGFGAGLTLNDTTDFDPGPGTYNLISSNPSWGSRYISKLNSSGAFIWAKCFTPKYCPFVSLIADASENLFITGSYIDTTDFDLDTGKYDLIADKYSEDVFIFKLDTCSFLAKPNSISGLTTNCSGATEVYSISPVRGAIGYVWRLPKGSTIISGQNTTKIKIKFGTISGDISVAPINFCKEGNPRILKINIIFPNVSFTAYPSPKICYGSFLTLSGTGAKNYTWSGGIFDTIPFAPDSSRKYIVTGTDTNGCRNTDTAFIKVIPIPTFVIQPKDKTIKIDSTAILIASSSNKMLKYQWRIDAGNGFNNVLDSGQFIGSQNDTLTIKKLHWFQSKNKFQCIINEDICTDTSKIAIITIDGSVMSLKGNLNYGNVPINTSIPKKLIISNIGSKPFVVNSVVYPFGFNGISIDTIYPNSSDTITITFTPVSVKSYGGKISIKSNANSGLDSFYCTGFGTSSLIKGKVNTLIVPTGAILAGAKWSLDSGTFQNSGTTLNNVPSGSRLISFKSISGWIAPLNQTINITDTSSKYLTGTYTQVTQYGDVKVNILPSGAISVGAQWNLDGGSWNNSGITLNNIPVGNHTINYKTISNWTTPSSQITLVKNAVTNTINATYIQVGTPYIIISSPNGGEIWDENSTNDIKWTSSGVINVKIEYSLDGGNIWNSIISSISASKNKYSWLLPKVSLDETQCLIKITEIGGIIKDQSKGYFIIRDIGAGTIPAITNLQTTIVAAQTIEQYIDIEGANFLPGCLVEITNGTNILTNSIDYYSSNKLTFKAIFLQSPLTWQIRVINGTSYSNKVSLIVANFSIELYNRNFYKRLSSGTSLQNAKVKICADGGASSYFLLNTDNPQIQITDLRIQIKANNDIDKKGYFFNNGQPVLNNGQYEISYQHPIYCNSNKQYDEFNIEFTLFNNQNYSLFSYPIRIYRAPILFVHGFVGDESTFYNMDNFLKLTSTTILTHRVDYMWQSLYGFKANENVVPDGLKYLLNYSNEAGFSTSRADLIGHSMGGILIRQYQQNTPSPKEINRIITLNTPHSGTQLANLCWYILKQSSAKVYYSAEIYRYLSNKMDINNILESAANLKCNSPEIAELNLPLNLKRNIIPSSTIFTSSTDYEKPSLMGFGATELASYVSFYALIPAKAALSIVFNQDISDAVVPAGSQKGGIDIPLGYVDNQFHIGSAEHPDVISFVNSILRESPKNQNYYSTKGFNPPPLQYPSILRSSNFPIPDNFDSTNFNLSAYKENGINILYPKYGSVFKPGEKIVIECKGNTEINKTYIDVLCGRSKYYKIENSNIAFFNYEIPINACGNIYIVAKGFSEEGYVDFDTTIINVTVPSNLDSIKLYEPVVYLSKGYSKRIKVEGYFSDGVVRDITENTNINIGFSPILKNNYPYIYGLDTGFTQIEVSYLGQKDSLKVYVYNSIANSTKLPSMYNNPFPKLILYPNPVDNKLNLQFYSNTSVNGSLQIYSVDGKLLEKLDINNLKIGLNLISHDCRVYPNSIYFYKLILDDHIYTGKFLTEHQ